MVTKVGRRLWDLMTDERPQYYVPSIVAVVLIVGFTMLQVVSWATVSHQIAVIEATRASAVDACRDMATLRAYQSRTSKQNETILSWQMMRKTGVIGPLLVPRQWDDVAFLEVPGAACPELE